MHVNSVEENSNEELNRAIKRFWGFEDLPMCTNKDVEHELVEQIFQERHSRDETGRFVVEIPLNPNVEDLGSSRAMAL